MSDEDSEMEKLRKLLIESFEVAVDVLAQADDAILETIPDFDIKKADIEGRTENFNAAVNFLLSSQNQRGGVASVIARHKLLLTFLKGDDQQIREDTAVGLLQSLDYDALRLN